MIYISAIDIPLALLVASLAVTYLWLTRKHRGLPLPPGPKGWPLIGNVFDMPMIRSWEVYHKWCKEFSEHSSLESLHLASSRRSTIFRLFRDRRVVFERSWDQNHCSGHIRGLYCPVRKTICHIFGKVSRLWIPDSLGHHPAHQLIDMSVPGLKCQCSRISWAGTLISLQLTMVRVMSLHSNPRCYYMLISSDLF